ncbi:MAG: histidinol dehydrogenase, partial [Betaproteobacteria bacterium]
MRLRRLSTRSSQFDRELEALTRFEAAQDDAVEASVRAILADVRKRGDAAVLEYARRFDRVAVHSVSELEVGRDALRSAYGSLAKKQAAALTEAAERIRRFHERQLGASWEYTEADGTLLGQKVTALDRVGLYVPGGKAAYP